MPDSIRSSSTRRWLSLAALLAALAAFFAIGARNLMLPGLYADEALDALPAMDMVLGIPSSALYRLHIGSFEIPLMQMPYVGAQHSWYLLPWFALFGPSVAVLRLANLCLGALTLVLVWLFIRSYLDERIAGLTVLLLALDPGYVFGARLANVNAFLVIPLAVSAVWGLSRWYKSGSTLALLAAAFCLGIGVAYKIVFLWYWLALGAAWLVLSPHISPERGLKAWLWPWRRSPKWWKWLPAVGAAVLGASPLLAYNLHSGGATFNLMRSSASSATFYGVNNRAYLVNLGTVLSADLPQFLSGAWAGYPLGAHNANPLVLPALLLSLALLGYLAARGRLTYPWQRLALPGIIIIAVVLLAPITVSSLGAFHLAVLWPWPQVCISAALWALWDAASRRKAPLKLASRLMAGALACALAGWSLAGSIDCQASLARTHGQALYSDAIYALADDLSAASAVVLLDWGLDYNLDYLSQRQLPIEERYDYSGVPGPELHAYLEQRVTAGEAWYVLHAPEFTVFGGHYEALEDAAARAGLQPVIQKTYTDSSGRPLILVYRLEQMPRLFAAPQIAQPLAATFGSQIELLGYDLTPTTDNWAPGQTAALTLYWRCLEPVPTDYKVFVHLVGPQGELVAQADGQPQNWGYPTSRWQSGEYVPDKLRLTLPAGSTAGIYRLYAGMYAEASGERLPIIQDGHSAPDGRFLLAEITIR